jgi:hypothetical protein
LVSILKTGKDPTLPSPCRSISLPDTLGEIFENILLTGVLREVNGRGTLRDEQFRFRLRHSKTLQLARLVESGNRKFNERRLTEAVFMYAAKNFHTIWVKALR